MTQEDYINRVWKRIYMNDYFPNNGCLWKQNEQYDYDAVISEINGIVSDWLKVPTHIMALDFNGTAIYSKYYDCDTNPYKDHRLFNDLNIGDYIKLYGNYNVFRRIRFFGLSTYETAIFWRFIKDGYSSRNDFGEGIFGDVPQPLYSWGNNKR